MTTTVPSPNPVSGPATGPRALGRLFSLDALRGITIAFMIMVNNNGSDRAWWFMKHADWNGLTPTDLVFPTFLFVVGASAFPQNAAPNPTLTVLALTYMSVDAMINRYFKHPEKLI